MFIQESETGSYVISNGREYSYFGGNNYLGMATHPAVKKAATEAIEKYGVNFSASRCTTGTSDIHLELERQLSLFTGKDDTVIFASGYMGNSILLEVLKEKYSAVFADSHSHSSIRSAIPLGRSVTWFDHCNTEDLDSHLSSAKPDRPLIITDGIFALTGEIAPLDMIFSVVKKYKGILVVDDAHATGVLGITGKGSPEYFNLHDRNDIYQTGTMSKAIGSYGGFIPGSRELINLIRVRSTAWQASTSLPPPLVVSAIASLKLISGDQGMRKRLIDNAISLKEKIASLGLKTIIAGTPIVPIFMSSQKRTEELSAYLETNRIIVPYMNYPSGQGMNLLRIALTVSHTETQVNELLEYLRKWTNKNGNE